MKQNSYRSEIDGLRAFAVAIVVLFHAGLGVPGGYIGVDIFFVISGFLITGVIRREMEQSTFSLVEFWERRVRRIYPALFVAMIATLTLGYFLLLPVELVKLGMSALSQPVLLANVYFWRDTGYFDGPAEERLLLHTWSLAVEEQFYLIFPILLLSLKTKNPTKLFQWLGFLASLSFVISTYGVFYYPRAAFYLLPSRAWELLVGCMLYVFPFEIRLSRCRDELLGAMGVAAIVFSAILLDSRSMFPGPAALPSVLGTAAIIFSTRGKSTTLIKRLMSFRPIVFIGRISYSLYLWHWPVIVSLNFYFGDEDPKTGAIAISCSLILAAISWRFVEIPYRNRVRIPRKRLFILASSSSALIGLTGILFIITNGMPERFPPRLSKLLDDTNRYGEEYAQDYPSMRFDKLPKLGVIENRIEKQDDIFLWGDSHGMRLAPMINEICIEYQLSGRALIVPGRVPLPGICQQAHSQKVALDELDAKELILEYVKVNHPSNLVLICRWSWYIEHSLQTALNQSANSDQENFQRSDKLIAKSTERNVNLLKNAFSQLISVCEESGTTVWIVKQAPEIRSVHPARDVFFYMLGLRHKMPIGGVSYEIHIASQSSLERVFRDIKSTNVRFLDPAPLFFDKDGHSILIFEGRSYYQDYIHLTKWGCEAFRGEVREMLREMQQKR